MLKTLSFLSGISKGRESCFVTLLGVKKPVSQGEHENLSAVGEPGGSQGSETSDPLPYTPCSQLPLLR